jgi:hypothetical protein
MGMSWPDGLESLITAVNGVLEVGDWVQVVRLTADLYAVALQVGEMEFAELVQDLHWIANDALAHPVETGEVIAP